MIMPKPADMNPPTELNSFETKLLNLLALHLVSERPQSLQIDLLNRAGFSAGEISALLRTTPNNVNVRLSGIRKQQKSK
ncbi:MAG: hypothetical protein QM770_06585 [Tepidisphaeraceae bacterium]